MFSVNSDVQNTKMETSTEKQLPVSNNVWK